MALPIASSPVNTACSHGAGGEVGSGAERNLEREVLAAFTACPEGSGLIFSLFHKPCPHSLGLLAQPLNP